jgi:hypothetical protein
MTEAQPVTPPTTIATPEPPKPDPAPVKPARTAEELKPDIPPPQPREIEVPDLPKKDNAEATLAPPPKPKAHKEPPPKAHEAERKKPIDLDKPKHRQTTAPPSSIAARSNTAAPFGGLGRLPLGLAGDLEERVDGPSEPLQTVPIRRRQHRNRLSRLHHHPVGPSAVRSPDRFNRAIRRWTPRRSRCRVARARSGPAAGFWRRRSNPHCAHPFRRLRRAC